MNNKNKTSNQIYVSYAWKVEEQNQIVDKLEQACDERDLNLFRDKKELNYKDSIRNYMAELAAGDAIILVLSEAYFKSSYCMYELCEVHGRNDFYSSIFPLVVHDTPLYEPEDRIDYLKFWEDKCTSLEQKLSTVDRKYTKNLNESLDEYAEYRRLIDEILAVLADMNTLEEIIHVDSDFEQLLDKIQSLNIQGQKDNKSNSKIGEVTKDENHNSSSHLKNSILSSKEIVMPNHSALKRIEQLEEQLDEWFDKLHEFEMELSRAEGPDARHSIKQKIKYDITPQLTQINKEYSGLVTQVELTESEAKPLVTELISITENLPEAYNDKFKEQLQIIQKELSDQSKSATAKLKVALPIIPGLVNYELELDTENIFTNIWNKIRGLLLKKV